MTTKLAATTPTSDAGASHLGVVGRRTTTSNVKNDRSKPKPSVKRMLTPRRGHESRSRPTSTGRKSADGHAQRTATRSTIGHRRRTH